MRRIITLTTDFGTTGPYVGAMKGVILSVNRDVDIVDITHEIPPQNIRVGALVLADATPYFPAGTIHVAVVDPGVGTNRAIVCAEIGGQCFLAPDNGLLTLVARRGPVGRIFRVEERRYWRPEVSATFHGRDIFAPVAARLAAGLDPRELGRPADSLVLLDWPEPQFGPGDITGEVVAVDAFGNLITNVTANDLSRFGAFERMEVLILSKMIAGISKTYGDRQVGELCALIGSSGRLEVAVVCGNAARELGAGEGTPVTVRAKARSSDCH